MLLSCNKTKQSNLLEIPIDIHQNSLIPLSEIAEEVTAIDLELTDESLISPMNIQRIIVSDSEVFIASRSKILVFNKTGKFIRSIGSQGKGPGEYSYIRSLALDEKNKRFFITSYDRKIISYDMNGKFLNETSFRGDFSSDINYINGKLLLFVSKINSDSKVTYSQPVLYRLNDNFNVVDSCIVRNLYLDGFSGGTFQWREDFILNGNQSIYLYYGDFFTRKNLGKKVLCDTLYRFENNHLIPDLKLKFDNDRAAESINLFNIYRSLRYIFAVYRNTNDNSFCFFCYDTKTGKGYNCNTQGGNGFIDDINEFENQVQIRPFNFDTEMFYYIHTNMKPEDKEEPNPTLYIGKLKK